MHSSQWWDRCRITQGEKNIYKNVWTYLKTNPFLKKSYLFMFMKMFDMILFFFPSIR